MSDFTNRNRNVNYALHTHHYTVQDHISYFLKMTN